MSEEDLQKLLHVRKTATWRIALARWVESPRIQGTIIGIIILNAIVLGMETAKTLTPTQSAALHAIDMFCLGVFVLEIALKLLAYRGIFWRNGWNWFDFIVVAIALAPGTGVWAVLRSLRVLRVLRLLSTLPQLRKVVMAFLHAIPGLAGVMMVMVIFFYTAGVLATNLFGDTHPQWFGTIGSSLFSLFQIMTLESWSMGIVRPLMETHPWAWAFFVPFIVIATFTILNLFIGIIVSTMQELSTLPDPRIVNRDLPRVIAKLEESLAELRALAKDEPRAGGTNDKKRIS